MQAVIGELWPVVPTLSALRNLRVTSVHNQLNLALKDKDDVARLM